MYLSKLSKIQGFEIKDPFSYCQKVICNTLTFVANLSIFTNNNTVLMVNRSTTTIEISGFIERTNKSSDFTTKPVTRPV